ncbi:MAG: RsmD family RNA methyltransferase [Bacteroidetes bacterium]|nr:RsmD family RNA methyltransferase [Bacteroidota bacterium]
MTTFRDLSLSILTEWQTEPGKLSDLINHRLESHRHGFSWRGDVSEMVFGTVRLMEPIDKILAPRIKPSTNKLVRNILRLALYELLEMTGKPAYATIHSWVETAKARVPFAKGMVNAVLQGISREKEAASDLLNSGKRANFPEWMVADPFLKKLSAAQRSELSFYLSTRPEWYAAVNGTLTDSAGFLEADSQIPDCFKITAMSDLLQSDDFKSGKVLIMDAASQLVARYGLSAGGKNLVDLCAAPGGKLIYANWFGRGIQSAVAIDRNEQKVSRIRENLTRVGLKEKIRCVTADSRNALLDPADLVWVDAPCTGSGVINRKPDIRDLQSTDGLKQQLKLQAELLDHAATLVVPGGHLVYSTCSILQSENEDQVKKFLDRSPGFTVFIPDSAVFKGFLTEFGLRTYPGRSGLDGACAFILKREK